MAKTNKKKEKRIDFKYNIKEYLGFLKQQKKIFILVLLLILVIEGLRIISQFLFKILIDNGTEFSTGAITSAAFTEILLIIAAVYISKTLIVSILVFFRLHTINRLDSSLMFNLKKKYFDHLVHLDYSFHTSHKTGSLISRLIRSGGAVERMTDVILFNFAPLLLQLTIVAISLAYFSGISMVIILITMVVFIGYSFIIQRKQEAANVKSINAEDREKGTISDIFTNIDSIKYFGKEETIKAKFKKLSTITRRLRIKHWDYFRWLDSVQTLILAAGTFFLIFFSMRQFLAGEITIGTVAFIYTVWVALGGHLFGFVGGIRGFYRSMADFQDLFEYGKRENKIEEKPDAKNLKIEKGEIEFKDMSFRYGKKNLFDGFNLKIKPHEKVALVGHSGCGKTTLVKLLYRLHDINYGSITIDGESIGDFKKHSLRNEMSIVPQECVLFDDTIYNNVAFSNPKATKQEVMKAMKFAQLDKAIADFPKKELTVVGERGVKLSGGEKQRVSIARAILANKKVLVLDEATSALDSQTEHEIQQDLEKLMEGRTSIIIAHRLSTIMKADKIVVMSKGKIVQLGSHRQLINQQGVYKKLWNLQKGGYIKE
jgi:ATP-binding cassette, subfamily B, heavy metal transporter